MARLTGALDALLDLQRSMERARSGGWARTRTTGRGAFPLVNVFEEGDGVVLVAEVPGVGKGDVEVQVMRDQIRVRGNKRIDYGSGVSLHRRERAQGSFDRTFTVPFQIDVEKVEAEHRNGVLAVRLPPVEANVARTITVE